MREALASQEESSLRSSKSTVETVFGQIKELVASVDSVYELTKVTSEWKSSAPRTIFLKLFRFRAAAAIAGRRLRDSAEHTHTPLTSPDCSSGYPRRTEIQCL